MPQINRGFSLSKMNKDFDERIVKEGEYRDALNIQIQASEGSDVGSAQSILGNVLMSSGMVPEGSKCVGVVTYDKEDKIYYLVAGPEFDMKNDSMLQGTWKDYIIEYDVATKSFKYVFVDIYRTHFLTSVDAPDRYLPVDLPNNPPISNARRGMIVNGFDPSTSSQFIITDNNQTVDVTFAGAIFPSTSPVIQIYSSAVDYDDTATNPVPAGTILQCTSNRALNFQPHNLITGINIIDGMIFWTDNYSEPKKVNIKRSISGTGGNVELPVSTATLFTGDNADWHTRLCITPDKHHDLRVLRRTSTTTHYSEEENITVIKKGPRTPPMLEMSKHEDGRFDANGDVADTFSVSTVGIVGNPDNTLLENCLTKIEVFPLSTERVPKETGDDLKNIIVDNPVAWQLGDTILFNQQQDVNSPEGFTEQDVRATIVTPLPPNCLAPPCASTGPWNFKIESINRDDIDEEQKMWNLRLEQKRPMFEFKFVRFAYRYKYEDGEYSTFSPWSELAFLPGEYDFLPKKGYNLGMTNRLRQLKIKNYITELSERPKDVIEVDLLYKDESSPSIYTVETIKRTDGWVPKGELLWPDTLNGPAINATSASRGEYKVTSELIHKTVPSNQMLRPWDNVPRKALAQSISANRLVYGNYVQNFDITSSTCGDVEIKPEINVSLRAVDAPFNAPPGTPNDPLNEADTLTGFAIPGKTARSLRTYQIGVVYGDVYGRETPVLAGHNGTGSLTINKENSQTLNKISVDISTPTPDFAHYYKLYLKETSNEYYNLAMDRWYNAEDGNIWLSFASSDRNKVDEETNIILKKEHNSHVAITDPARYKILAIENSAPDFIKTNVKSFGLLTNGNSGLDIGTTTTGFPAPDGDKVWFRDNISGLSNIYGTLAEAKTELTKLRNKGTLYFRIRTNTQRSNWYQVAGYTHSGSRHKFKANKVFEDDMDFTSVGGDITTVVPNLKIQLAEFSVENKKEFEGRFFVKIYKDLVLENILLSKTNQAYRVSAAMQIGYWNIPKIAVDQTTTQFCANNGAANLATWESCGTNLKGEFNASGTFSSGENNNLGDWCGGTSDANRDMFFHSSNQGPTAGIPWPSAYTCSAAQRNVESWTTNSIGRFHIDNTWMTRGTKDDNTVPCGLCSNGQNRADMSTGFPSGGGAAIGTTFGRGVHNGGTPNYNGQSMDIGYISPQDNNQPDPNSPAMPNGYQWNTQADQDFYNRIRVVGTLFRWREDPEETVYVVTGQQSASSIHNARHGMYHTWHRRTSGWSGCGNCGWGNNKFRFEISFARQDGQPGGFGGGAGYHPIGGKDTTKIPNRKEMGYWGGAMSNAGTIYNIENGGFQGTSLPTPPGYGMPLGIPKLAPGSTIYTSTVDTVGDLGVTDLTVTKAEMGCRWRKHTQMYHHLEILEVVEDDETNKFSSDNPAIWETEPKEDVGMDIYYEASPALPIRVDFRTNEMFAPYGSKIVRSDGKSGVPGYPADNYVIAWSGNSVQFTHPVDVGLSTGQRIGFERPDGFVTYAIVNEGVDAVACVLSPAPGPGTYHCAASNYFTIRFADECPAEDNWHSDGPHNQPVDLSWYNAYAYGNGIESNRIRDDYNQTTIRNGVKASSVVATQYEEERRKTGLIHSGIYNSTSGINNLNQFIAAEKITKDMNPEYGSIQKLHTRDGDIVVMHEDKIMKVMADKDALFNADGKSNVAISSNFLGSDRPFATKYGISTNPESFATDLHGRIYFADRARSSVLRLSGDGITNISNYGMKDWFNDHLSPHTGIIVGSYDAKKSLYNISLEGWIAPEISDESTVEDDVYDPNASGGCGCAPDVISEGDESFDSDADPISDIEQPNLPGYTFFQQTLSFSEQAKGWVSFKSFFPECGVSINNEYYTWRNGDMYQHHLNDTRNFFYGNQYKSTIDILFNDAPEIVKSFTTLNYEGSQARISQFTTVSGYNDNEYFNLTPKDGWYIGSSTTNLQSSGELEFKNKEDKYFTYMKGVATTLSNLDEQEFSVQGIGVLGNVAWGDPGDPSEPPVIVDPVDYCLEITPLANCGEILGCMDVTATNYDATATIDDGSCQYPEVLGCTDPSAYNYDSSATSDDGSCCYRAGCMDPAIGQHPDVYGVCLDGSSISPWTANWCGGNNGYNATNYDPLACENEGCNYCAFGCTNPTALNYDPLATCDDGSCQYCNETGCMDCGTVWELANPGYYCNDSTPYAGDGSPASVTGAYNYDPLACIDNGTCEYECNYPPATSIETNDTTTPGGTDGQVLIEWPRAFGENLAFSIYIFDAWGNDITPTACTLNGCPQITNYNAMTQAMAGSLYACNDPDVNCWELNGVQPVNATDWAFYIQGLAAGDYFVVLINQDPNISVNGCTFEATFTIEDPMQTFVSCIGSGNGSGIFPNNALIVASEVADNYQYGLTPSVSSFSSNWNGHDFNYIPNTHAPYVLSSHYSQGQTLNQSLQGGGNSGTGHVVIQQNLQLMAPWYWYIKIGCGVAATSIPWELARSINYFLLRQDMASGMLMYPNNMFALNPAPPACLANCCESDNYGGPTVTHTNGMFTWAANCVQYTAWQSENYYTWADVLSKLNGLMYLDNAGIPTANKIFPLTFDHTLHNFFFVRNYITRWMGPCANGFELIELNTQKCDCDDCCDGANGAIDPNCPCLDCSVYIP